jgi:hypothetical protein
VEQVFSWCLKPLRPGPLPIHAAHSYITFYDVFSRPGQPVLQPVLLSLVRILFLSSHLASSKEIFLKRLKNPSHITFMFIYLYFCAWEYETVNVFAPYRVKMPCLEKFQGILAGLGSQRTSPPSVNHSARLLNCSWARILLSYSKTIVMWA